MPIVTTYDCGRFEVYFSVLLIINVIQSIWVLASWFRENAPASTLSSPCVQALFFLKMFACVYVHQHLCFVLINTIRLCASTPMFAIVQVHSGSDRQPFSENVASDGSERSLLFSFGTVAFAASLLGSVRQGDVHRVIALQRAHERLRTNLRMIPLQTCYRAASLTVWPPLRCSRTVCTQRRTGL